MRLAIGEAAHWCSACAHGPIKTRISVCGIDLCPRCAIRIGELGRHAQRPPVRVARAVEERMPEDEGVTNE